MKNIIHKQETKTLTRFAPIEVSSHTYTTLPSDWNNSDVSGDYRVLQQMTGNSKLIRVTSKFLHKKEDLLYILLVKNGCTVYENK